MTDEEIYTLVLNTLVNTNKDYIAEDEEIYNLVLNAFVNADKRYIAEQVKDGCKHCSNNPKNGGTGVCHCVLGNPVIY